MSRHTVPCLYSGFTVVVGWDNPLSTFFAQVSRDDAGEDDDPLVLWLGTRPHQIISPQELVAPLAPFATITDDMIVQLRADRAACLDRAPSTLQRALLDAVRRMR